MHRIFILLGIIKLRQEDKFHAKEEFEVWIYNYVNVIEGKGKIKTKRYQ